MYQICVRTIGEESSNAPSNDNYSAKLYLTFNTKSSKPFPYVAIAVLPAYQMVFISMNFPTTAPPLPLHRWILEARTPIIGTAENHLANVRDHLAIIAEKTM